MWNFLDLLRDSRVRALFTKDQTYVSVFSITSVMRFPAGGSSSVLVAGVPSHTTSAIACSRGLTHFRQHERQLQPLQFSAHMFIPSSLGRQRRQAVVDIDVCWCLPTAATNLNFLQHFDGLRHGSQIFTLSCGSSVLNRLWVFLWGTLGEHMVSCASFLQPWSVTSQVVS